MDAKITVQLNRPDEGVIPANSVAVSDYRINSVTKTISFPMTFYTAAAWAIGVDMIPVPAVTELPTFMVQKVCTNQEWDDMNELVNSLILIEGWYKTALESIGGIGVGNVVIL